MPDGWRQQFNRVERFLLRTQAHDRASIDYDHDLWAFFQNCWHLKDWIKNDNSLAKSVRDAVEKDDKKFESIMICCDLANGSKHLKRKDSGRLDANVTSRSVNVFVPCAVMGGGIATGGGILSSHTITLGDGTLRLAQQVALDAFRD